MTRTRAGGNDTNRMTREITITERKITMNAQKCSNRRPAPDVRFPRSSLWAAVRVKRASYPKPGRSEFARTHRNRGRPPHRLHSSLEPRRHNARRQPLHRDRARVRGAARGPPGGAAERLEGQGLRGVRPESRGDGTEVLRLCHRPRFYGHANRRPGRRLGGRPHSRPGPARDERGGPSSDSSACRSTTSTPTTSW